MNHQARLGGSLVLLALLLVGAGVAVGSTGLQGWRDFYDDPLARLIVLEIRLPRSVGAWLTGALLGLAGAIAQGLFRNPLADPFLLGSASGSTLGVALALWLGTMATAAPPWLVLLGLNGAAFVGALAGVFGALVLARGADHSLRLLLAGVVVGFITGAAKDLVAQRAPGILSTLQAYSLGSTGLVNWEGCVVMAVVLCITVAGACSLARVLDALALGTDTAFSLGMPLPQTRLALVLLLALATGTAVAQTGLIAFVGLAAPHLVRSIARPSSAGLLWLSALAGGTLLLAADVLARLLVAPEELPVGIVTGLLGGAYLSWLMHRRATDENRS